MCYIKVITKFETLFENIYKQLKRKAQNVLTSTSIMLDYVLDTLIGR